MAENPNTVSDRHLLDGLENVGSGTEFADQIFTLVGHSQFVAEFSRDDIAVLAGYLRVYHAQPGQTLIREGDAGDYMLFLIRGEVGIYKRNPMNEQQHLTTVTAGMTLGEMSMVDGKPRFATCIALKETTFGVLMRDSLFRIILEQPGLGTKILLKVGTLLSQRLRQTSARLLQYMSGR